MIDILLRNPLVLILSLLVFEFPESEDLKRLSKGEMAPQSNVAYFVTGPWSEHSPRTVSPVLLHRSDIKLGVYTRKITPSIESLISKLDEVIENESKLKWSFVYWSHENNPVPTEEELSAHIRQLKELAIQKSINHLSLGVLPSFPAIDKPQSAKRRLGFLEEDETLVMLISPSREGPTLPQIQYLIAHPSGEWTDAEIERTVKELVELIKNGN